MDQLERSQDIYEVVPGYPPAPQPPLPAPGDFSTLEAMGLTLTPFSRRVIGGAMRMTGFNRFWPELPHRIDDLQRRVNLRGPALYAQAVSATLALADDPRPLTPFQRAAALVLAVRQLRDEYFSGALAPDMVRGEPAEMGQYANLFSTSVAWEDGLPRLYKSKEADRIAVLAGGRFFIVDIKEATADELAATLESCVALAAEAAADGPEPTIARLTAASDMTQWKIVPVLVQRPANAESLEALKHTLVTVCLDLDDQPADPGQAALIAHRDNPDNRCWYASLQLVVFGNAKAAAACSFSAYLDGNVMMRGGAEIVRRAADVSFSLPETRARMLPVRELHWAVGQQALDMADADRLRLRDEQPVATYEFVGLGQRFFDAAKVDAVPAFVLALALATKRFTGTVPLITQFLTMSRYRCTDLVTAMVTLPEVAAFVDAGGSAETLRPAVEVQKAVMSAARKSISLQTIFRLYINSDPAKRNLRGVTKRVATAFLRRTGAFKPKAREIVISHPAIYPEVPIVGRPGARLPYTKYFGLHYQIWDDRTVVTFMPGTNWQVKNGELAEELRKALEQVGELARK
jgi:hypothetical protein